MRFKEIESKYRADEITSKKFIKWAKEHNATELITVDSYDYYYTKANTDSFIRYRAGSKPELTVKTKVSDSNNYVRVECNLHLCKDDPPLAQHLTVTKFCDMLGYHKDFFINKICTIAYWDLFNVVHYTVYDGRGKLKGSFIEIEMREDFEWESDEVAWRCLLDIEKWLKPLGILPKHRLRKSLFEMFRTKRRNPNSIE